MNCFIHPRQSAVGNCVSCGQGVCIVCLNKEHGRLYCDTCIRSYHPQDSLATLSQGIDQAVGLVSTKNRYLAAVLAIFLGSFGIHKFYLGQMGWGLMYFLFSWTFIPGFASMVEGIMYLISSDASFARRYGNVPFIAAGHHPPPAIGPIKPSLRTAAEQERAILQLARNHQGVLSVAEVVAATGLSIEKVENQLAQLTARNVTRVEIDEQGRIFYLFPDFQYRHLS